MFSWALCVLGMTCGWVPHSAKMGICRDREGLRNFPIVYPERFVGPGCPAPPPPGRSLLLWFMFPSTHAIHGRALGLTSDLLSFLAPGLFDSALNTLGFVPYSGLFPQSLDSCQSPLLITLPPTAPNLSSCLLPSFLLSFLPPSLSLNKLLNYSWNSRLLRHCIT